jgi:hypothetical protein
METKLYSLSAAIVGILASVAAAGDAPETQQVLPKSFELRDVSITYERDHGYCPGCPKYTIALGGDGNGMFAGTKDGTPMGPVHFSVSPDSVLGLLRTFAGCGFFEFEDKVARPPTFALWFDGRVRSDRGPGCWHDWARVTVEIGSYSKSVEGGEHGPCSIGACGIKIDTLVNSEQWLASH